MRIEADIGGEVGRLSIADLRCCSVQALRIMVVKLTLDLSSELKRKRTARKGSKIKSSLRSTLFVRSTSVLDT